MIEWTTRLASSNGPECRAAAAGPEARSRTTVSELIAVSAATGTQTSCSKRSSSPKCTTWIGGAERLNALALQRREQLVERARDEQPGHRDRTFNGSSLDPQGPKFDLGDMDHRTLLCDELLDQDQAPFGIDELATEPLAVASEHIVDLVGAVGTEERADVRQGHVHAP
jgi:hypothetical protein